jgi:hypothetical protein
MNFESKRKKSFRDFSSSHKSRMTRWCSQPPKERQVELARTFDLDVWSWCVDSGLIAKFMGKDVRTQLQQDMKNFNHGAELVQAAAWEQSTALAQWLNDSRPLTKYFVIFWGGKLSPTLSRLHLCGLLDPNMDSNAWTFQQDFQNRWHEPSR